MLETKEWRWVDKSTWGQGPWLDEPDKRQWEDSKTGMPCLIVRGPTGALCGYVGVKPGHLHYNAGEPDLKVHGGVTYGEFCMEGEEDRGVCHQTEDEDRIYWIGFDCAHSGDFCPKHERMMDYEIYRDFGYVKEQVEGLAKQLKELER